MADYGALTIAVQANTSKLAKDVKAASLKVGDDASKNMSNRFTKGMGGLATGIGKTMKVAAVGVGAAALGTTAALVPVFKTGIDEQKDYSAGLAQLQAGLKSTKGVSGTTAKGLENLATKIQGYSGQTDDSIVAGEKLLLTFTGIRNEAGKNNDIFDQTTKASADMAARLGIDASAAAMQLGKALNDPATGMTKLARSGVSFTDAQKKQVVAMVDSGKTMQAQKLILGELSKEFGGSAKAAGESFPGQMERVKRSFEDVSQELISKLMPTIQELMDFLVKDGIPIFQKFMDSIGDQLVKVLPTVVKMFDGLWKVLKPLLDQVMPQMLTLFGQIGEAAGGMFAALAPVGEALGTALSSVMKALGPVLGVLAGAVEKLMQALAPVLTKLAPILGDVAGLIGTLLVGALTALTPLFRPLGRLLTTVVGIIAGLVPVLTPIIDVVVEVANALIEALAPILGVITDALKQVLPPIMLIVGAIGEQLVGVIKELMPILKPLGELITQVLTQDMAEVVAILDILTPIIVLLVQLVGGALKVAIKVLTPVLRVVIKLVEYWSKVMTAIWRTVGEKLTPVVKWLGKTVKAVWANIRDVVKTAWEKVLHPVLRRLAAAISTVGDVFTWLWRHVLKPLWGFISKAFEVGWRIIRPILADFHDALRVLGRAMSWLYDHVVKPVWDKVGKTIEAVWRNVIKPVLDAFHDMPGKIADAFRSMKGTLGTILGGLWKALGEPVYMVAHHVLKPLISGVNWLLDKVGLAQIPISWIESIPHFAEGGRVPGGWGGGDKVVAAVEPGEWVLTKRQARSIGYGNLARLPHYAEGGAVGGVPSVGGTSWYNPVSWGSAVVGAVVSAGKKVWDFGENVVNDITGLLRYGAAKAFEAMSKPLVHWLEPYAATSVPPGNFMWKYLGAQGIKLIESTVDFIWGKSDSSPEGVSAEGGTAMRQRIIDIAKQQIGKPYVWGAHGPDSFDCSGLVEYAYRMAGYAGGKVNALGATTKQQINMGRFVPSPVPADLVFFGQKTFPHHVALSLGGNKLIQAPQEGENVGYADIWSYEPHYFKRLLKIATGPAANESNQTSYTGSASVDQWASAVATAARLTGTGPINGELIGGILQVMASESSGNPNAQNNTDINARNGIPSQGLMQVIPPTFAAYAEPGYNTDIRDPVSNLAAAMNYMRDRYGSVWKAIATRMQQGWYDEGGLLPVGASIAINHTRKPEPILTADQWDRLTAAATADRSGGTSHVVTGGNIAITADSQGRLRAWVQDLILEEGAQDGTYARMGGGTW